MFHSALGITLLPILIGCVLSVQAQPTPPPPSIADTCSYTFTSGVNNTFLKFCVTANANIIQIETPAGHEFILRAVRGEGYGICNESPVASYWDYSEAGDSGNWNPPTLLSLSATSVKIARTTNDGIWTLTQTISLDARTPAVRVAMAVRNNTVDDRKIYLIRYADIDGPTAIDNFDATANSAFGWDSTTGAGDGSGLMLRNVGTSPFGYVNGFAQNTPAPPHPCAFAAHTPFGPVLNTDGSVVLAYVQTIKGGTSKTATMVYRGL